jgi:outer membrane usher protein
MRAGLSVAGALAFSLGMLFPTAASATQPGVMSRSTRAPLQLVVNGVKHEVAVVLLRDGDALVPLEDFQGLEIAVKPAPERIDGINYVSLAALAPRLHYEIDDAALELHIHADASLLPRYYASFATSGGGRRAGAVPSGFLTYSLSTNTYNAGSAAAGFAQAGLGSPGGLFLASASYGLGAWHRGLFDYQRESQDNLSRETLGDELAGTDPLGGSEVIGGLGFSRHFEFQPDYAFYPTPGISGSVLNPTTADIYVNGAFYRTVQLEPGSFDLSNIAGANGANVTQIVLHDANGNTSVISGLFYETRSLLRKGLTDYDYHAGFLRMNPYGPDDTYGPFAAMGSYRLGLTNAVTAGVHIEQSRALLNGGPSLDIGLPIGVVSLETLRSDAGGIGGSAMGAAFQGQVRRATFLFSAETRSAGYATLSLGPLEARTRSSIEESVALPLTQRTAVSFSHETSSFSNEPSGDQVTVRYEMQASRNTHLGFDIQRNRGGSPFGLGSIATSQPTGSRWSVGAMAIVALRGQAQVVADSSVGPGGGSTVSLVEPVPVGLGFGYNLNSVSGPERSIGAEAMYHSQVADFDVVANSGSGAPTSANVTVSGSVAAFDQGIFFARPIYGGYALVEVPGFKGLPVYLGSELAAKTDGRGAALIPGLQAYQRNEVGLGDLSGRPDLIEDQPSVQVDPKTYSAVIAELPVRVLRAYYGHVIVRRSGAEVVPAFTRLVLMGRGHEYSVDLGSEGQFYFDNLVPGRYDAVLTASDYTCSFPVIILSADGSMTHLGTLVCEVK